MAYPDTDPVTAPRRLTGPAIWPPPERQGVITSMGVPKRRVSHARQGDRRAHLAITVPHLEACPHCHQPKQVHHACPVCGYYNGRPTVEIKQEKPQQSA